MHPFGKLSSGVLVKRLKAPALDRGGGDVAAIVKAAQDAVTTTVSAVTRQPNPENQAVRDAENATQRLSFYSKLAQAVPAWMAVALLVPLAIAEIVLVCAFVYLIVQHHYAEAAQLGSILLASTAGAFLTRITK